MYPGRIPQNVLFSKPNLKIILNNECNAISNKSYVFKYSFLIRDFTLTEVCRHLRDAKGNLLLSFKNARLYKSLQSNLEAIPRTLKDQSSNVLRAWTHQCECVIAQRLRRGQQMFCLYTKLWEDRALKEFLKALRQSLTRRGREFLLASVGFAAYNWDENRIPDDIIKDHLDAVEYTYLLKAKTVCHKCPESESNRKVECQCERSDKDYQSYDNWVPFIEDNDLIVWRRVTASGQYEYKVYGSYDDVTAQDFLNVQIDTDYRKLWDATAVQLEIIESDPKVSSNSDIVYWEMLWPKIFANRDYVFNRKYLVDHDSKTVLVVNKATEHPTRPKVSSKHRVEDYWSYMVIKPYDELDKPGIEFVLTYFDNPGVNIPGSITAWVAYKAMPDFLRRLRDASKKYKDYCEKNGFPGLCNSSLVTPTYEELVEDLISDDTVSPPAPKGDFGKLLRKFSKREGGPKEPERDKNSINEKEKATVDLTPAEIITSPSPIIKEDNGFWKYLRPTYYFS